MKKIIVFAALLTGLMFISNSTGLPQNENELFDKIRLLPDDLPQGFIYGLIPGQFKTTLKNNPWIFDRSAIEKLADKIYPGGDYRFISSIHLTILTRKERPYFDEIVCYIIKYKDAKSAKAEVTKLAEYVHYNGDRALLHVKDNLAVFLFVDDIKNYNLLLELDKKIAERISKS